MSALAENDIGMTVVRPSWASPRAFASVIVTVALVGAWFIFLRPTFLGGPTSYVLVSGQSMEPTLHDGDFVIARHQASYRKGDIAVYRVPAGDPGAGNLVIHRIIGGSAEDGYLLQGDNRTTPDLWRPRPSDMAGSLLMTVPRVGRLVPYLRSPFIVAAFTGYMAFLLVYLRAKDPESDGYPTA